MATLLGDAFGMIGTLGAAGINAATELGTTAMVNKSNEQIATETNEANVLMTRETNAANVQNVESTNATNLQIAQEANALAVQEADKSYERSTATNQLAELMRAGFSAQQAKEIVAGSGSAPGYTAAPVQAAQMQAAQQVAPQMQPWTKQKPDFSGMYASLSSFGESLFASLSDPNGGALGAMLANDPAAEVFSHKGDEGFSIDDARTVADFEEYAKGHADDPDHWSQKLVHSKQWQRLKKTPSGMKGYAAYMSSYANSGTQFEQLKQAVTESRCSLVRENLLNIQYDRDVIAKTRENLLKNREEELANVYDELALRTAQNSIAEMIMQYGKNSNPRYVQAVLDEAIADKETSIILHKVAACDNEATLNLYKNNPDFAEIVAFYRHLNSAGLRLNEKNGNLVVIAMRAAAKLQSQVDLVNSEEESEQVIKDYFEDYVNNPDKHKNPIDLKYDSIANSTPPPSPKRYGSKSGLYR